MKGTRRKFLAHSFLGFSIMSCAPVLPRTVVTRRPLVVSTWDSGVIANKAAWPILSKGGKALDAVEQAGIAIENDVNCCVGLGGNPDREGYVTLDACIMDDRANCGSVAFLERVKHPVSVARKVMEETPHVMLVGEGAQQFAISRGFELESGDLSPDAKKAYDEWLQESKYKPLINIERNSKGPNVPKKLGDGSYNHDTMGTIAIDKEGRLSGMCTTSGMGFKMRGRVGDSPIIGAGLFVENEYGAAVATGQGEEVIRASGCHLVVEFMRSGMTPQLACEKAIARIVKRNPEKAKDFQVAFIAINKGGEIGAYAIQKGFNYTISNDQEQNVVLESMHFIS